MNKKCLVCQSLTPRSPTENWIEEKQYSGPVKNNNLTATVYYCSLYCLDQQLTKREQEDFNKGFCEQCGEYLVVLNEQCQDEKHKQEAHYYRCKGGEE